jgi:phage pi2 protein 07
LAKLTQKQVAAIKSKQRFKKSTEVQSVIITKRKGLSQRDAISSVKNAGFKASKVDEKKNTWRFRQQPPSNFIQKTFRTKKIKPGIQLVVAVPKN